ncbi:hypothetical protein UNSW1_80 [Campylobacter concisus UNSW1]|nr:hypothetical protein UNSW1_80 [Campylobacter concisus UNSW1]
MGFLAQISSFKFLFLLPKNAFKNHLCTKVQYTNLIKNTRINQK